MKALLVGLNAKFYHMNLAIRNIKKYCESFNIELFEATINDDMDFVLKEILKREPNIVEFSCYIWNIEQVLYLCEYIKKINKKIIILLGGPEASYDAVNLLKNKYVDYVVLNEGEKTFKDLLEKLNTDKNIDSINGIAYREKDERIIMKPEKDYVNLDDIPFPYDGEDFTNKLIYYETSRGCPFKCSYCLSSLDN